MMNCVNFFPFYRKLIPKPKQVIPVSTNELANKPQQDKSGATSDAATKVLLLRHPGSCTGAQRIRDIIVFVVSDR